MWVGGLLGLLTQHAVRCRNFTAQAEGWEGTWMSYYSPFIHQYGDGGNLTDENGGLVQSAVQGIPGPHRRAAPPRWPHERGQRACGNAEHGRATQKRCAWRLACLGMRAAADTSHTPRHRDLAQAAAARPPLHACAALTGVCLRRWLVCLYYT